MITRIEIDGFKSLRGFAMDLEPFTVLIGPNSAGKSNVLDAVALLSRLASMPIADAFKQGRGKAIDQFNRHGGEVAGAIRFAVELLEHGWLPPEPQFQSRFRYELTIERQATSAGTERLVVGEEQLHAMHGEDDAWIAGHRALAGLAGYAMAGKALISRPKVSSHRERPTAKGHTALSTPADDDLNDYGGSLRWCRVLDLGAAQLGAPSERIDSGELSSDASNLPSVLAQLPPRVLGEIRADITSLVPGIASFDVVPDGDEIRLEFELSGGNRLPAHLVSAGTRRLLALLTALRMEPRPAVLCIEEPENGIYPARLRALLELLRAATAQDMREDVQKAVEELNRHGLAAWTNQLPTQILLTTHSPVALAALHAHPEHIRFVDMVRRGGERITRVRTVGKPSAEKPGWLTVSPREINALLHAARAEDPEA